MSVNYQQSIEWPDRYEFVYTIYNNGPAAQAPTSIGIGTGFNVADDIELPDTIQGVKTIAIDWRFSAAASYTSPLPGKTFIWLPTQTLNSFSSFVVSGVEYSTAAGFWQMTPESGIVDKYLFPFSQSSRQIKWAGYETQSQTFENQGLGGPPALAALATSAIRVGVTIKVIAYKNYIPKAPVIRRS